jgi:hypothetical protein
MIRKEDMTGKEVIMKTADKTRKAVTPYIEKEDGGLIRFLAGVNREVVNFDRTFEFGVSCVVSPPSAIDGNTEEIRSVGFVVVRDNILLHGRTYCLYALLKGDVLCAYIGVYSDGNIETVRELPSLKDFKKGRAALLDWLKALVKASCEKP